MRNPNATAASLLGLLHDGPPATAWERTGDFRTLTQSQVHREPARMTGDGPVTIGAPGPRERKPYPITETGRAAPDRSRAVGDAAVRHAAPLSAPPG